MLFPDWPAKPWGSGRTYPNGPGEFKVRCLYRNPPWYMGLQVTGLDPDPAGYNTTHWCYPYYFQGGVDSDSSWALALTIFPDQPNIGISWKKNPDVPGAWVLESNLRYGTSFTSIQIYRTVDLIRADDWMDWDNRDFTELVYQSPSWAHGSPQYRLRIGTYAALPAHSCIGDYNGPWPP